MKRSVGVFSGMRIIRGIRLAALLTSATALALCATASSAGAAVTIGATFTPTDLFGGPGTNIQSGSPGNSYTVPTNGVITSWSFEAAADFFPPLKLKVVRPTGGDDFTTVGDSRLETPTGGTLNTFKTRISVRAGDLLGNFYSDSTAGLRLLVTASGFNAHQLCSECGDPVFDPPAGTKATYTPSPDVQIDVSAVLEPDCDNDGLGDETQDNDTASCRPAAAPPPTCKGKPASIVGTNGNDLRTGTPGPDVIVGQGGNDTLSGLAGNDLICGGSGKDTLKGGAGKDSLLGQKGKDTLKGGGGKDLCKGGKGTDTASKCEVEKSI
jgi:Ca2+-binding RTX toxin-like protein